MRIKIRAKDNALITSNGFPTLRMVPFVSSALLFFAGTILFLFTTTSLGILLATIAKNIPQQASFTIMVMFPMVFLSGAFTPVEGMPDIMKPMMVFSPLKYYMDFSTALLFKGAGLDTLWDELLIMAAIGAGFFAWAAARFRVSFGAGQ